MKCHKWTMQVVSLSVVLSWLLVLTAVSVDTASQENAKDVTINLTAKNHAFNVSTITVPAGANVTINFDNMDQGVEHNFAIYETADAKKSIFIGDEITGPDKITYNFEAPIKAGTYFFRCDDHPDQMKGNFIVQ